MKNYIEYENVRGGVHFFRFGDFKISGLIPIMLSDTY